VSHDPAGERPEDESPGDSHERPHADTLPPTVEVSVPWDDMATVNLTGDELGAIEPSELTEAPEASETDETGEEGEIEQARELSTSHLQGLLEALIFASDKPMKDREVARLASAPVKQVRALLAELKEVYAHRGIVLDEVAGGWLFRTSVQYAPFVREMSAEKPVRLSRAQVETLAIAAYRQPITRPEIDDIRGVDSGATLKLLLERDLVRILGKKDEPGRPLLYGTTTQFLEFFGLRSLKDLPTLKEFTELSDESRRTAEATLGEVLPEAAAMSASPMPAPSQTFDLPTEPDADTLAPPEVDNFDTMSPPPPATQEKLEDPSAPEEQGTEAAEDDGASDVLESSDDQDEPVEE
jgi:segregation and condensation protein B